MGIESFFGGDPCSHLSKRQCKNNPDCEYDRYEGCILSDADDYDYIHEDENDECSSLSKRRCKRTTGCEYSRRAGSCTSSNGSGFDPSGLNGNGDDEDGQELRDLTPPEPNVGAPEEWMRMKNNKNTRGIGMHRSCACFFPLPWWLGMEGGFWCACI